MTEVKAEGQSAVWGGEAHLHQVPKEHLPILGAADYMRVTLTQAAVQLVLLVLMACVPGGGWDQWGLDLTRGRGEGGAPQPKDSLP